MEPILINLGLSSLGASYLNAALVTAVQIGWIAGIVALVVLGGVTAYYFLRRKTLPLDDRMRDEVESPKYEQVHSELQGIKLKLEGGDGRGNFPKISRLVRIFADRAGVVGARDMKTEELGKAIEGGPFSAQQSQVLMRIVERCETASAQEKLNLDFDPIELIIDFRNVVYQMEGREST